MAYWWVSQNQTYQAERNGGYLWAPKSGKKGVVFTHWSNMSLVRQGDVIFSYAGQAIGAVGVAASDAYDAPQPEEFGATWQEDGRKADVLYTSITPAVRLSDFVDELIPLLPDIYAPLTKAKKGVQGYLFALPPKAGQLICEKLGITASVEQIVTSALNQTVPDQTTREALVKARIGQGRWRSDLMQLWSGRCAVTQLDVGRLLRASHIKPWRDSNNSERLNVFNGLLLSPAYDAAFDAGLISFAHDGRIIVSPVLTAGQMAAAGISSEVRILSLQEDHLAFLDHHRTSLLLPS